MSCLQALLQVLPTNPWVVRLFREVQSAEIKWKIYNFFAGFQAILA